ncbi:hypothetical protein AURDEDRAFT_164374 [Auricularia subglabra TFB-10046 SS5]|nr:hypothetical protein AURDEDRAFT_164374 [Auricularia subglabra TFB-10046 SS5]
MVIPALLVYALVSHACSVNVYIDDTYGDSVNGQLPEYLPESAWNLGAIMDSCGDACPLMYHNSWHNMSGMQNQGNISLSTAISAFFMAGNENAVLPSGLTINLDGTRSDGRLTIETTLYQDPRSGLLSPTVYTQYRYRSSEMAHGPHTLVISYVPSANRSSVSNFGFDYAMYTCA